MSVRQPILDSKITIIQVLEYTHSKFRNRFRYRDRDVLIQVNVKKITTYDKVEKKLKETYYKIEYTTYSFPQYFPYTKHTKGTKQRKYKHNYTGIIELLELNLNSKFRWRCGWDQRPKVAPKGSTKSISIQERQQIKSDVERVYKNKTKQERDIEYKKRIKARQSQAKYLNNGDYNGRGLGEKSVMLDWWYRISYPLKKLGGLYGKYHHNEGEIFPFFTKHDLRIIDYLIKKKILLK